MTTEFKDAAAIQSKALGFEPGILWMPHPVQNRTPEELKQIAADSVAGILKMITSGAEIAS
ncbi:MAG: hypothetical protein HOJ67_19215 [Rhodospirillaceae bacterium]|nr:hypothetical protein [Rhodospirillales bacterium]MBT3906545.1 hypothetical protein [Rhodospirillaceae bacterium]MBT5035891.1 hypothetical protein [Rhodospirillaceae bacterium]MBT6222176.1 hypothetical protein [Rhodospirillaceae bacterium]MBT6364330.1 hypothetical protein [Rhodospirillaceae bacterium]